MLVRSSRKWEPFLQVLQQPEKRCLRAGRRENSRAAHAGPQIGSGARLCPAQEPGSKAAPNDTCFLASILLCDSEMPHVANRIGGRDRESFPRLVITDVTTPAFTLL